MKVICISGKAQHGKTTTANCLFDCYKKTGHKVLFTNYGDLLKYIAKAFFNWNGEKDEAGRTLLQSLGDRFRNYDRDYFVKFIVDVLKANPKKWDAVLIGDCRFPNEIEIMKKNFDTVAVRVDRGDFTGGLTDEQRKHISETALDNYVFDYVIKNDGSKDDFEEKIRRYSPEFLTVSSGRSEVVTCSNCGEKWISYWLNRPEKGCFASGFTCKVCDTKYRIVTAAPISFNELLDKAIKNGWLGRNKTDV